MPIIAEFSVPVESFALADTLPQFPDVVVEADRVAAHAVNTTMPSIWVTDGDAPEFATVAANDSTVNRISATADFDDERLYHIEWSEDIEQLIKKIIDHEGVILEASGKESYWRLRIRFITREQFEDFQTYVLEDGPPFTLEQLFAARHPRHTRGDVTPEQQEALTLAADLGYFQVPRETSIVEVAEELGISDQAVSERIRRGTENLVRDMLIVEPIQDR